jgi:hypothetical protein
MADAYRAMRRSDWDTRWLAAGTLAFLGAVLMAGMFEFNYGDSEVLYVILLLSPLPYVLTAERASE